MDLNDMDDVLISSLKSVGNGESKMDDVYYCSSNITERACSDEQDNESENSQLKESINDGCEEVECLSATSENLSYDDDDANLSDVNCDYNVVYSSLNIDDDQLNRDIEIYDAADKTDIYNIDSYDDSELVNLSNAAEDKDLTIKFVSLLNSSGDENYDSSNVNTMNESNNKSESPIFECTLSQGKDEEIVLDLSSKDSVFSLPDKEIESSVSLNKAEELVSNESKDNFQNLMLKSQNIEIEISQSNDMNDYSDEIKLLSEDHIGNENISKTKIEEKSLDKCSVDVHETIAVIKPKSKKKGNKNKGKDKNAKNSLIDEKVLSEVENLINAVEGKGEGDKLAQTHTGEGDELALAQTKTVKDKKKKKVKRSNSKNHEGTIDDPVSKSSDGAVLEKRVILKRGAVWKIFKTENLPSVLHKDSELEEQDTNSELILNSLDEPNNSESTYSFVVGIENNCKEQEKNRVSVQSGEFISDTLCITSLASKSDEETSDTENRKSETLIVDDPTEICTNEIMNKDDSFRTYNDTNLHDTENEICNDHSQCIYQSSMSNTNIVDNVLPIKLECSDLSNDTSLDSFDNSGINLALKNDLNIPNIYLESQSIVVSDLITEIPNNSDKFDVNNEFVFDAKITIVEPLHPFIEYVSSSSSSSLSTRSNSLERSVIEGKLASTSQNSLSDFVIPLLFDDKEFSSKLDGIKNLKFKNKKRHSVPKVNSVQKIVLNDISSNDYSSSCHDIKSFYENAGEKLYNENCHCSEIETTKLNETKILSNFSDAHSSNSGTDTEEKDSVSELNNEETKDSDETDDIWHHKNIKEKIEKIIGVRLKHIDPCNELVNNEHLGTSTEIISLPVRAQMDNGKLKSFKSNSHVRIGNEKVDRRQTNTCSDTNDLKENSVSERSDHKFAPINSKHMNLTFLTDSDDQDDLMSSDSVNSSRSLKGIVDRWGNVQAKALERQKQSAQFRQLQRQIKSLRLNMESVLSRCSSLTLSHTVENFAQLPKRVEDMKSLLCETEALRADLSGLNVIVHRFSTEMGPAFTPLKDEMAELYRLWDETHRRVNSELTHLQTVSTTCNLWEEQKLDLCKALKQDSEALKVIDAAIDSGKLTESVSASVRDVAKLLNEKRKLPGGKVKSQNLSVDQIELSKTDKNKKEDRLSDSGTSGYESCSSDDLSERERRLAYLRRLAKDLQSSLVPGTSAWNEVNATLDEAEKELKELQDHCRMLIMKTAETLEPNPKPSRFSSNCKRRNWVRENKSSRSPRSERRVRIAGNRRSSSSSSSWVWRVARAALPFQVALMLVLCVAYLLEPNCCDSVNTFNLSFTPQLRFVHGSPPV